MISLREIIIGLCPIMVAVVLLRKTKEAQQLFSNKNNCCASFVLLP